MEWRILIASIFIIILCKAFDDFVDMSIRTDLFNQLIMRFGFIVFVIDFLYIIFTLDFNVGAICVDS